MPGIPLGLWSENLDSAFIAVCHGGRSPAIAVDYLFHKFLGGFSVAPFEFNTSQVFFSEDSVLVQVHSPGNMSLNILSINAHLLNYGINLFYVIITHHGI